MLKKILKIVLIVIGSIVLLGAILAGVSTIGLNEARELDIDAIDLNAIDNGVYTGSYENARWSNTVEVTVKDHNITQIMQKNSGSDGRSEIKQEIIQKIVPCLTFLV